MLASITFTCADVAELEARGTMLAEVAGTAAIIFLQGPLGAGKTTLSRGFLRGLGFNGKVKSPTYTLVEPYELAARVVYHFDFYRIADPAELLHSGMLDYFAELALCLVEWPEMGGSLLPAPDLVCYLAFAAQGRRLTLEAHSLKGKDILQQLMHQKDDE